MISIINNILTSNGYQTIETDVAINGHAVFLFQPNANIEREEYFVTIQPEVQSDETAQRLLAEEAQVLFEAINASGKVERPFEKNCTMLICCEEGIVNRDSILSLEEDQYNFKKNVVAYTLHELAKTKAYLAENEIKKITNKVINDIVNSEGGKNFLRFKAREESSIGHYSLILKAALKLPFITYSPQEQKLANLSLEIDGSLTAKQSTIYAQLMEPDMEWTDENIYQHIERIWGGSV